MGLSRAPACPPPGGEITIPRTARRAQIVSSPAHENLARRFGGTSPEPPGTADRVLPRLAPGGGVERSGFPRGDAGHHGYPARNDCTALGVTAARRTGIGPALLTWLFFALPVLALAVSRGLQIWPAKARKTIAAQTSTIHRIVKTAVFTILWIVKTAVFVFGVSRFAFSPFTVRNISLALSYSARHCHRLPPDPRGCPPPPARGPRGVPVTPTVGAAPPGGIWCFHVKVRRPQVNGQPAGERHPARWPRRGCSGLRPGRSPAGHSRAESGP